VRIRLSNSMALELFVSDPQMRRYGEARRAEASGY
jgi:hypothetical protein